jgi:predicted nucleotidyltransferase
MNYGLKNTAIHDMQQIFQRFEAVEKVLLYGSRAMDNYRPNSDIDLTLVGNQLDFDTLLAVDAALDDLLLPYKIDLSIYHQIENTDLQDHIQRVGKVFYQQDKVSA